MEDRIKQLEYKGYKINIYRDELNESPQENGDDNLFLVGYHRDFWIDPIKEDLALCIMRQGKYEDGSINTEARDYLKKYHIFGLEAYIHSGVSLSLSSEGNFPDRQWDVSQLGLVFASKKEWRLRKSARKACLGLIETWNTYLSGDVYGYMIENKDGEENGGCWGYYGHNWQENGLLESAQDEIKAQLETDKEIAGIAKMSMA